MAKKDDLKQVLDNAPGLIDDGDIVMPSLSELMGFMKLSEVISLDKLIELNKNMYKRFIKEGKLGKAPSEFIGFIIPFDSYVPLPDNYGANMVYPDEKDGALRVALATISSVVLKVQAGKNDMKLRISVVLVSLGDFKSTTKKVRELGESGSLNNMYEAAVEVANNAITAYKLTPFRHNHDLKPVSVLNRPSTVEVVRFNIDSGKVSEKEAVTLHRNLYLSVLHARSMTDKELENYRKLHYMLGSQMRTESIMLSKIYEAIDARCIGQDSYAIVLADTYAEHVMRYVLFQILLITMSNEEAGRQLDRLRTMDVLLRDLARNLSMTKKELIKQIKYKQWFKKCRELRNSLTHRFNEHYVTQEDSQIAINETIEMIDKLTRIVETKYDQSVEVMKLFQSLGWYIKSKQQQEQQVDSIINAK